MTLNSCSSCLHFPKAEILTRYHHVWLTQRWWTEPRTCEYRDAMGESHQLSPIPRVTSMKNCFSLKDKHRALHPCLEMGTLGSSLLVSPMEYPSTFMLWSEHQPSQRQEVGFRAAAQFWTVFSLRQDLKLHILLKCFICECQPLF